MHGNGSGMVFGGGFMWVIWILLLVVLVVVIKALVGRSAASGSSDDQNPMEILRQRYARGEIDEEEFERRRRELEH